jgi:HD superfamily phosphohydrolase
LRVSGLLHDVGHGPFGHFFDHNHLAQYGLGHEAVGQQIILRELGEHLRGLRRSPSGAFAAGEVLEPEYVAYLMQKKAAGGDHMPPWLRYLKPVLSGMYTADNLDYVLRDAYMCGVAIGPVDLERLLHYTVITPAGLTLHRAGIGALTMFLTARLYLYTHVYFHRTTRALDLHLREIFPATMHHLFPGNPLDRLDRYVRFTDWFLLETVRNWLDDPLPAKRALSAEWHRILQREVKWKMAYDATLSIRGHERQTARYLSPEHLVARIRQALAPPYAELDFQLDIAAQDPRNLNPLAFGTGPVHIYDPATDQVSTELLEDILEHIPARMVQYRLYTTDPRCSHALAQACEVALRQASTGPCTL